MSLFGSNYSKDMWYITCPNIIPLETPLTSSRTHKFMSEVVKLIWWRWPAYRFTPGWNGGSFDVWSTHCRVCWTRPLWTMRDYQGTIFSKWGSNPCKIYVALTNVMHNESAYIKGYIVQSRTNSLLAIRTALNHVTGSNVWHAVCNKSIDDLRPEEWLRAKT